MGPISAFLSALFIIGASGCIAPQGISVTKDDGSAARRISSPSVEAQEPLRKKGFGIVVPAYRSGSNDGPFVQSKLPFADIAYKRFLWSELEPEEGRFDFRILDEWIGKWRTKGYRVGFGVMSTTVGRQGTPLWVFKAGVPGVAHMAGKQRDPVMWEELYLRKLDNFIQALGSRLDGGQDIEFIDMRGIGVWGEMHFGFGIKGMWTAEELYANGFGEEALMNAHFRQMDSYKAAFPHTILFLNIVPAQEKFLQKAPHLKIFFLPKVNSDYVKSSNRKGRDERFLLPINPGIIDRAVALGIGLRSDGLSIEDNTGSQLTSQYFQDCCCSGGPVKCFYEFAGEERDPAAIKKMLSRAVNDCASYININFQSIEHMKAETVEILRDTAEKIGYQYIERTN